LGISLRTPGIPFTAEDCQTSMIRVAAPIFCSFAQGWRQNGATIADSHRKGDNHPIMPNPKDVVPEGGQHGIRLLSSPTPDSTAPRSQYPNNPRAPHPDMLHPTLSSWLRNMRTFSTLIDRLQEIAITASKEHQSQLKRQVTALRTAFKKQQKRYIAFLQLTKEYADRFLLDISEKI
jgi:hypothetical protein